MRTGVYCFEAFWHHLGDFDGFRHFDSWQWLLAVCKFLFLKAYPKSIKNNANMHEHSLNIHPKSTKMGSPKTILEEGWFPKRGRRWVCGALFAITGWMLAAIFAPAGRQGGSKIVPFGTMTSKKSKQMRSKAGCQKKIEIR